MILNFVLIIRLFIYIHILYVYILYIIIIIVRILQSSANNEEDPTESDLELDAALESDSESIEKTKEELENLKYQERVSRSQQYTDELAQKKINEMKLELLQYQTDPSDRARMQAQLDSEFGKFF